jgi:circadian clock protein KaiB
MAKKIPESRARQRSRTKRELEAAAQRASPSRYVLKLYVAGTSRRSATAIRAITEICEQYLKGRYELRIIDIYQQPTLAKGEQIIAAPTLIRKLPLPLRRFIGDLADTQKVLVGLDVRPLP